MRNRRDAEWFPPSPTLLLDTLACAGISSSKSSQARRILGANAGLPGVDLSMPLQAGVQLGHYEIVSPLGAGGMGEVYRARDSRLGREVAVKVLPEHLSKDSDALSRFEREARAVAALSHPNILTIFDFGSEEGIFFAVTELLTGETLRERLMRAPYHFAEALDVAVALAEGLAAAHEKSIVHRDLKPENLFLTFSGALKILDFGLARIDSPGLAPLGPAAGSNTLPLGSPSPGAHTSPGMMLGTVGYMSPEQVRGHAADARTDIFSVGCVLYEMISGSAPFKRQTSADTLAAILSENPAPLETLSGKAPLPFARIVHRCLEKQKERRLQSARELALVLRQLRGGSSGPDWPRTSRRTFLGDAAPAAPAEPEGLAVLPLENLSGDAEQEFFAVGMTDALIADLAKIGSLRIISRRSVMQYKGVAKPLKEIARELNVGKIVEGTVVRSGERVRINVQLIEAETDRLIWTESYERDVSDILSLQREVARAIAGEIRIKLTPEEREALKTKSSPAKPAAVEAILKGTFFIYKGPEHFVKAKECFEEAIRVDPDFAGGYAGLAIMFGLLGTMGWMTSQEANEKSRAAALRAVELDDTLPEGHISLGSVKMNWDWDWAGAEKEYKRAVELNPGSSEAHHFYSRFLDYMGRFDEALYEINRARELDPRAIAIHSTRALYLRHMGRREECIEECRRTMDLEPNYLSALSVMGIAYRELGRYAEAEEALGKAVKLSHETPAYVAYLACTYALWGREADARKWLESLHEREKKEFIPPGNIAMVYAALDEKDKAFEYLEKAYAERSDLLASLRVNSAWDPLRSDPRFVDLLRRVGHPVPA